MPGQRDAERLVLRRAIGREKVAGRERQIQILRQPIRHRPLRVHQQPGIGVDDFRRVEARADRELAVKRDARRNPHASAHAAHHLIGQRQAPVTHTQIGKPVAVSREKLRVLQVNNVESTLECAFWIALPEVVEGHRQHVLARRLVGLARIIRRQPLAVARKGAGDVGIRYPEKEIGLCAVDGRAAEFHAGHIGTGQKRAEVVAQSEIAFDESTRAGQRFGVLDAAATTTTASRQAGRRKNTRRQALLRMCGDVEGREAAVRTFEHRRRHAGTYVEPICHFVVHMEAQQIDGLVALHAQNLIVHHDHGLVAAQQHGLGLAAAQQGDFWFSRIRLLRDGIRAREHPREHTHERARDPHTAQGSETRSHKCPPCISTFASCQRRTL